MCVGGPVSRLPMQVGPLEFSDILCREGDFIYFIGEGRGRNGR